MQVIKYLLILIISFYSVALPISCELKEKADNYLVGMSVEKTFGGDYSVRLKFKNNTDKKYKLKELGNNSYALILPQVKSIITEEDINYDGELDDIKIVFSEKPDLSDQNNFYTKINFKTKKEAIIKIDAYTTSSFKQTYSQEEQQQEPENIPQPLPEWLWYISTGILSLICILLMTRRTNPEEEPEAVISGKAEIPVTERNSFFKTITPPEKTYSFEKRNPLEEEMQKNISIKEEDSLSIENVQTLNSVLEKDEYKETDEIVDKLVKIIIPKNDLILMPGVPELPGLEGDTDFTKNANQNINTITLEDNNKNKSFNFQIQKKDSQNQQFEDDLTKEADVIIFEERSVFFNSLSPLPSIQKKKEPEIENENTDEYEKLIEALKNKLKIAHKIKDEQTPAPEIIDAFAIDDSNGFCLVQYGQKISLTGYLKDKIFILKTFNPEDIKDETLFMEFCTQNPVYSVYSVILNNFKALIRVAEREISLIGEYD